MKSSSLKTQKKNEANIQGILTKQALANKWFITWPKKDIFLAAWVANQNSVFSSSCLVSDLAHNNYCKFGYELAVTHYFFD